MHILPTNPFANLVHTIPNAIHISSRIVPNPLHLTLHHPTNPISRLVSLFCL